MHVHAHATSPCGEACEEDNFPAWHSAALLHRMALQRSMRRSTCNAAKRWGSYRLRIWNASVDRCLTSGIRTPSGAALCRFRRHKQNSASDLLARTALQQPVHPSEVAAMAIGRLSIAAAALVVLAFGASAARHPGEHCRCMGTSIQPTFLCYLACEPEKVSLYMSLLSEFRHGFWISDTGSLMQRSRVFDVKVV